MSELLFNTQTLNNVGNLSEDVSTKGFDLEAGQSWIYPTNYPIREYQYTVTKQALFKNTLVSLPTGLGKTFIAAVVMYNFFRWYPYGKVIFMAPTRPLVKQQLDACYNITAIPQSATVELTGAKAQESRCDIWLNKRVFFITPQVLLNDLPIVLELGEQIKCLVFDEAHRAKGNHAYCEVIKRLKNNKYFRVLALSASPGNTTKDVLEVMENLLIAHVEFRSEESPDVKPYIFNRSLETVVVPLGEKLQQVKDEYIMVLEKYTRSLVKYKVIHGNCSNLSKGRIHMILKDYNSRSRNSVPHFDEIVRSLNICFILYHAYECLIRCGLRIFLKFLQEQIKKPLFKGNLQILKIMDNLDTYLGPAPEVQPLPDGTFAPISLSTKFGHPKFYQLVDILTSHFSISGDSTRVIVFFEFRDSVEEAYALLLKSHPLIRSRKFVGQNSGVTQRDQINTIKAFRDGTCNTLLSTCIGEEGLDVGEVDLIVVFDIANKSPIRMLQRMGRTGRKKQGRIVVLVTEGKEQQTLKDCLISKQNLETFVMVPSLLENAKYENNPSMIPSHITPQPQKMFITVDKPVLGKNNNIKDVLRLLGSNDPKFDDMEIVNIREKLPNRCESIWDKADPISYDLSTVKIDFTKHLDSQKSLQNWGIVKSSTNSNIMVDLLQFADSIRYNLPVSQLSENNKQLKQTDIRYLFGNPKILKDDFLSQITKFENEKAVMQGFHENFFMELTTYLKIEESNKSICKTCQHLFECPIFDNCLLDDNSINSINISTVLIPDLQVLENLTKQDWQRFAESLKPAYSQGVLDDDDTVFNDLDLSKFENCEISRNFENILEPFKISKDYRDVIQEQSFAFEKPKNFGKLLSNVLITRNDDKILAFFQLNSIKDLYSDFNQNQTTIYDVKSGRSSGSTTPDNIDINLDAQSPVLSSFKSIRFRSSQKNFEELPRKKLNFSNLKKPCTSFYKSKESLDIDQICDLSQFGLTNSQDRTQKQPNAVPDIGEVCNLSMCGSSNSQNKTKDQANVISDIGEICDLSMFGLTAEKKNDLKLRQSPKTSSSSQNTPSQLSITQMLDVVAKNTSASDIYLTSLTPSSSKPSSQTNSSQRSRRKKIFNIALTADSDEEFEEMCSSRNFKRPKLSPVISSNFVKRDSSLFLKSKNHSLKTTKRKFCEFLDDEAEVSQTESVSADEDCDESRFEESFVDDEATQNLNMSMQARYLQSITSPSARINQKVLRKPQFNVTNILSQPVSNIDNTYVNDSFCVGSQDVEIDKDISELDILEMKLGKQKINNKKNMIDKKRKRIIEISDDSDNDIM